MKKKQLFIVLMLICMCGLSINTIAAQKVTKKNWYNYVLKSPSMKLKYDNKNYKVGDFKYYQLIDIDKDGIKELLLAKKIFKT